jgi:uncharacterized protein (DUF58 family)
MLTRSGWLTLLTAIAVGVAGRIFAIPELFVVSATFGMLALVALAWVRFTVVRVSISRSVQPINVYAGETTKVEVTACNTGVSATPVLHMSDPVAGTKGARLSLAPLRPGTVAQAAYRLPTDQRGVIEVGPLRLEISDPFGLASRRAVGAPVDRVTIYPHVDAIAVPSLGGEEDPHGTVQPSSKLRRTSDEFFGLRNYVVGDDLRRVHWKSTARTNELMVRMDESPWQDCTTVAIDVRPAGYDAEAFERAISAAASVAAAGIRQHHLVRLVSSDGFDTEAASGLGHSETMLGYLAGAKPTPAPLDRQLFNQLYGQGQGGLLVLATSEWSAPEVARLGQLRRHFQRIIIIGTTGSGMLAMPTAMAFVDNRADADFPTAWGMATAGATWRGKTA